MIPAVTFDERLHEYRLNGELMPHVTGMLEHLGVIDFSHVPRANLERKTLLGQVVHKATALAEVDGLGRNLALGLAYDEWNDGGECYRAGLLLEDCEPYYDAWFRFLRESRFESTGVEQRHVAEVNGMRYGMTADRTGRFPIGARAYSILDLKCTAGKEPSWPIQLAGYALGLPKPPEVTRWARAAVWLRPDRKYSLLPGGRNTTSLAAETRDEAVFVACLQIAHWKREHVSKGGEW